MNKIISSVVGLVALAGLILGITAHQSVPQKQQINVGAATGPDTYFDYVANNSFQEYAKTVPFTTGTTTVCAIKSPNSTSTLVYGSAMFIVSSTTASTVTLANSTSPSASTTPLTVASVSANAQGTIMSSSTPLLATGLINNIVFAPNTFFTVNMAGGIGTFSPTGNCSAEFIRN